MYVCMYVCIYKTGVLRSESSSDAVHTYIYCAERHVHSRLEGQHRGGQQSLSRGHSRVPPGHLRPDRSVGSREELQPWLVVVAVVVVVMVVVMVGSDYHLCPHFSFQ